MKWFLPVLVVFVVSCKKDIVLIDTPKLIINQLDTSFSGYKVGVIDKNNEGLYWKNCGVMWDVIYSKINNPVFLSQLMVGDFNNDGYIDIFNSGTGSFNGKPVDNFKWLIWNNSIKKFENKNLFIDSSFSYFGGNQRKTVSIDLNKDGYTDMVIFDHGDDIILTTSRQPIRIILSDGKGRYNIKELNITKQYDFFHGGDVADLNNDGYPDLVIAAPNNIYICWGNNTPNYFDFAEEHPEMGGSTFNLSIGDVNKDNYNDLIVGGNGSVKIYYNNQNKGFIDKTIINMESSILMNDFVVTENGDILTTGATNYNDYFFAIIKTNDGFKIDSSQFVYTINKNNRHSNGTANSWKAWVIYHDFNNDGLKDVSYIDSHDYNKTLQNKTVFVKRGNEFIEEKIKIDF
jgi:hypothetical protein